MENLTYAILSFSDAELARLEKELSHRKLEMNLLKALRADPKMDNHQLASELGYEQHLSALYTLKNKLFDSIINFRMEDSKNELIRTKERVQNLRSLVYSNDKIALMRELKKLERSCLQLELYEELREVYFCFFLLFRHDKKVADTYRKQVEQAEKSFLLTTQMEKLFYYDLLDTQDFFYNMNKQAYYAVKYDQFQQLRSIHAELQNRTSDFFYLSADLTLKLNGFTDIEAFRKEIFEDLQKLQNTYQHSFLVYRYPNCQVAIQCLYSRYYFLTGDHAAFQQSQHAIHEKRNLVQGYAMFDCSYFFYVYISSLNLYRHDQFSKIASFIENQVQLRLLENASEKMRTYFYYLLAVKEFYKMDYDASCAYLYKSRLFFKHLDPITVWVAIDNILLSVYNMLMIKEYKNIASEISALNRLVRRFQVSGDFGQAFKLLGRLKSQPEREQFQQVFTELKEKAGVMRLIAIN